MLSRGFIISVTIVPRRDVSKILDNIGYFSRDINSISTCSMNDKGSISFILEPDGLLRYFSIDNIRSTREAWRDFGKTSMFDLGFNDNRPLSGLPDVFSLLLIGLKRSSTTYEAKGNIAIGYTILLGDAKSRDRIPGATSFKYYDMRLIVRNVA